MRSLGISWSSRFMRCNAGQVEISLKMADRDVDKGFLIGPTCDGVELPKRVRERQPDFGLMLNLALNEDPQRAVSQAVPALARVAIGNCIPADGDSQPCFGASGGVIGVTQVSEEHPNVVACEVRPGPNDERRRSSPSRSKCCATHGPVRDGASFARRDRWR